MGLALDDFGTGYSSISHLRNFDLELVKLDRSYVVGLGESPEDDSIVRHIVALARSLGIATLAEGVSERSHVERLLELGGVCNRQTPTLHSARTHDHSQHL